VARVFIDTHDLESAVEVREAVRDAGHEIEMIDSADEVETRLREDEDEIALILTGDLSREAATDLVRFFGARIPRPPLIGLAHTDSAEELERLEREHGLDEVLGLPPAPDDVVMVLEQQLERFELQLEMDIVGRTEPMREILEKIHLIAPVNSTVLLTGESGTGKELVARAVHRLSPRRGNPFIAVNCAALPESLLESELFGHEKGAFTGATSRRKGMFELADQGTILLDEIGEMPPSLQTRLLRVLENRSFMRVGGDEEIEVDVRVVAATNQELRSSVQRGSFRRDLYYRLNVLHLELPPLRERGEDIPLLVRRFVQEFSESHDREFKGISPEALQLLMDYAWPGNVRELRNLVESMVVLAPGSVIRPEDIPSEIRSGAGGAMLPARRDESTVPETVEQLRTADGSGANAPELEFVFRTLVDLKMDVEDLRKEFQEYRRRHPELVEGEGPERSGTEIEVSTLEEFVEEERERAAVEAETREPEETRERPHIEFEPGMSMSELEREAIVATLKDVDGNRRKAAEALDIGERTLYRKLREYDIEL